MIKSINENDIEISSLVVHKTFSVSDETDEQYGVFIQDGVNETWANSGDKNSDGTYKSLIYQSINNIYYTSNFMIDASERRYVTKSLSDNITVCNIPQELYGLEIQPGTINISSGSIEVTDDEHYNLYSGSTHVGNVFYESGQVVITHQALQNLFDNYTLQFESTEEVSEYQVLCNVMEDEFNYSSNPSCWVSASFMPEMISEQLTPYITSLGLYNEFNELVAIAKFPRPVKKYNDIDLSFLVKFDF